MFSHNRYVTVRVSNEVDPITRFFMWTCIDMLAVEADYLQVFELVTAPEGQKIVHTQEQPPYCKEYLIPCNKPIFAKIFVIDDGTYATMLFAEEY